MDAGTHKRYLEYLDRHAYFGATGARLTREQFAEADAEQRMLDAKGEDGRDDDQEARYAELSAVLFRD